MIDKALETIRNELNAHYRQTYGLDEDKAVIANLISQEGSIAAGEANKVVITLINIEQETTLRNQRSIRQEGDDYYKYHNSVSINFYIVVAAYFSDQNYLEAMRFISSVILFFQNKKVFDHVNTPQLDKGIDKLTLEMFNLDLNHLSNFWSFIGAKYLPSLIFKVRMLTYADETVVTLQKGISGLSSEDV